MWLRAYRRRSERRLFARVALPISVGISEKTVAASLWMAWSRQSKRAEDEQQARTTEILESISDAFYAVDAQFQFTYVNRKADE